MTRMRSADRRRQITEAALEVVGAHGVQAATTARIAEAAGITAAALYRHFESRTEVLVAAIDALYDRIEAMVFASSDEPNVLERLRNIGRIHSGLVASDRGTFIYPFVEFLASPRESGLREAQGVRQLAVMQSLAAIVEEGKAQGSIGADVDSEQVAWALHAIYWAEDISHLMGLGQFVTAGRSTTMLNQLLASIAPRPTETANGVDLEALGRLIKSCPALRSGIAENG